MSRHQTGLTDSDLIPVSPSRLDELHCSHPVLRLHPLLQTGGGKTATRLPTTTTVSPVHKQMLALSRTPDSWPTGLFVICSAGCGFNSHPEFASPQAVHHVVAHGQGPQLPADQQTTVALQSRPPRRVGLHHEGSHHTQRNGTRRRRRRRGWMKRRMGPTTYCFFLRGFHKSAINVNVIRAHVHPLLCPVQTLPDVPS